MKDAADPQQHLRDRLEAEMIRTKKRKVMGRWVLFNDSDKRVFWDDETEFTIMEAVNYAGPLDLKKYLVQRQEPLKLMFLTHFDGLGPHAFSTSDENCALVQLRAHLPDVGVEDMLEDEFMTLYSDDESADNPFSPGDDWRQKGVSPEMIIGLAQRLKIRATILDCNNATVMEHVPEVPNTHHRSIGMTISAGHCYLYSSE